MTREANLKENIELGAWVPACKSKLKFNHLEKNALIITTLTLYARRFQCFIPIPCISQPFLVLLVSPLQLVQLLADV
jgi:hypothetical protein